MGNVLIKEVGGGADGRLVKLSFLVSFLVSGISLVVSVLSVLLVGVFVGQGKFVMAIWPLLIAGWSLGVYLLEGSNRALRNTNSLLVGELKNLFEGMLRESLQKQANEQVKQVSEEQKKDFDSILGLGPKKDDKGKKDDEKK